MTSICEYYIMNGVLMCVLGMLSHKKFQIRLKTIEKYDSLY